MGQGMPRSLEARSLTFLPTGMTAPDAERWSAPAGCRAYERTVRIGSGERCWQDRAAAVLAWGIKTRSGFSIDPDRAAHVGQRHWVTARLGPIAVREPVEVVAVVADDRRSGFAYGTLDGHPVVGEEAFIVHRDDDGQVWLTLRSLTRAGRGWWRPLVPLVLVAQRVYRRRYLRALVD